jgi:hypothetical protein
MTIYQIKPEGIEKVSETSFIEQGIRERHDLQRMLLDRIDLISDDLYVITEEFGNWTDSSRRIDILAIDRDARLVVIELKRTQDGGHMELQALRYAAMISTMTFDQVVQAHAQFLARKNSEENARDLILNFLSQDEPDEENFGNDVRIFLVSAEFSKELTTAVMWMNSRDLDITCIRMTPYRLDDKVLLDVQQMIPLPEAAEYQVRVREKDKQQRAYQWKQKTLPEIWRELKANCSPEEFKRAEDIFVWLQATVTKVFPTANAFAPFIRVGGKDQFFFKINVYGEVEIGFHYLRNKLPFADETIRLELLSKLNRISGVNINKNRLTGKPKFPLKLIVDDHAFALFKETFEWAFSVVRGFNPENEN